MQKIKKIVYPFAFVIISFIYLLVSLGIVNIFFHGDWSALGVFFIAVILLLLIILPIYCVKYSKIIQGERFKVLFATYNALIIVGSYMLPFIKLKEAYGYGIVIFVWVLFWSVLFLKSHTQPCEDEAEPLKEEISATPFLLQNNKKNILAICFTSVYIISLARNSMVWQFNNITFIFIYTLPLFSAVIFLVFLLTKNVNYLLKNWLLPFALAGEVISGLFSIYLSLSNFDVQLEHIPLYPVVFTFSCLSNILIAVMFAGTLFNLKYIKLFKYGALGYVILSVASLIFNLINVGGVAYHQIDLNGTLAINIEVVIELVLRTLYFMGIFILTTNKRNTNMM